MGLIPGKTFVRVRRITLPRYEIEYRNVVGALKDARQIKDGGVFAVEHQFAEQVGQEVVLDLTVEETTLRTTLLFRIIGKQQTQALFEWWARRNTDQDLLDLWLESLGQAAREEEQPALSIPPVELQHLYDLCRRALSANSFVALNIHWGATEEDVKQAHADSLRALDRYKQHPALGERAAQLIAKARFGIHEALQKLATLEQRQAQRARFVQRLKLEQARDLVESKIEIACLRGDRKEQRRQELELLELKF